MISIPMPSPGIKAMVYDRRPGAAIPVVPFVAVTVAEGAILDETGQSVVRHRGHLC